MIVISGALVLVALALLVIGLLEPHLGYVYASIAVSLAAFGFLIGGILQRRGEIIGAADDGANTASPAFGAGSPSSNVVTTSPSRGRTDEAELTGLATPPPDALAPDPGEPGTGAPVPGAVAAGISPQQPHAAPGPPATVDLAGAQISVLAGPVLIMASRPHYHLSGCQSLLGEDAAEVDVRDARDEGFTSCGACKPDQALGPQRETG